MGTPMGTHMDNSERNAALKWGISLLQFVTDARGALDETRCDSAAVCIDILRAELEDDGAPRDESAFPEPASTDAHAGRDQ